MSDWTGVLSLDMINKQGKTIANNVYFQGAFKVMRPIYHQNSQMPCYYLLNPGGGFLDGDSYRMNITVNENAALTLTTQSSTKVYKTPTKQVYQEANFHLKENSYVEYMPDALIAYENARYFQKNNIHMDDSSTLIYADILTPGWSPKETHFSYDMLRLQTEVFMEDELVAFDHIKLAPNQQSIASLGFMEGYTHLGSLLVISPHVNKEIIDTLYESIHALSDEFAFGISKMPINGFTVRVMANYTQTIEKVIHHCHEIISQSWYGRKPSFLRKY